MGDHPTFRGEGPLEQLVAIAGRQCLAELHYRKTATARDLVPRIVEPYSFTQGKQDVMVKCFQLEPEAGWRFFMIHRIEKVCDTGRLFEPRAKISMQQVIVDPTYEQLDVWNTAMKHYRNLVSDAMADGRVTEEERLEADRFARDNKLSTAQRRFVHASLFHRCLGAILEDERIDDEELAQLQFLSKVLTSMGWCPAV